MISYDFILDLHQSFNKVLLSQLQTALAPIGIFLDLAWKDDMPHMIISVPEEIQEKTGNQVAGHQNAGVKDSSMVLMPDTPRRRGRPAVQPQNNLTLGQVYHMRCMGITAESIAAKIGVSKRTFYRRLNQVDRKNISEDTPFSQWG